MGGRNQFSANGRSAILIPSYGPGKTFYVVPHASGAFSDLQFMFPVDEDGVQRVFTSLASALAAVVSYRGDVINVMGALDESVTISRSTQGLTIVGAGPRGSAAIAPTTAAATGLTVNADDVTLINMDVAGESTAAYAIKVTGSRFRGYQCKFEGVDTSGYAFGFGPGSDANVTAGVAGNGGDMILEDCEFAWSFDGINFIASDYGAATQIWLRRCLFHNCSDIPLVGTPGAFGIGSVRNLNVVDCIFDRMEDGTAPSDFVKVNDASDTGTFSGNRFSLATNAAADLKIGAKIHWMANATEAGWSTARPA